MAHFSKSTNDIRPHTSGQKRNRKKKAPGSLKEIMGMNKKSPKKLRDLFRD